MRVLFTVVGCTGACVLTRGSELGDDLDGAFSTLVGGAGFNNLKFS